MTVLNIDDFTDEKTWDLICSGNTKGVFQLESKLGSTWAKKSQPRNIQELADLISIIRPGTLQAELEGKNMTAHYVDRKHKLEDTVYIHQSLEPILNKTYGIIVYQEQAMKIATSLAGFTPEEADSLRKAMGKKDAALMQEVRKKFVLGCQNKKIVSDADAAQIFDWIQASARYSFNASHAIAYAINAYRSAYCKANSILKFYEVYLNHAENKPDKADEDDEIKELVMDAKKFNIEVYPPRLNHLYERFTMDESKNIIYFGYKDVRYLGDREREKLQAAIIDAEKKLNKKLQEFTWADILFSIAINIKKNAVQSLISVGAFNGDKNRLTRNQMLYEFAVWNRLTDREFNWLFDQWSANKEKYKNVLSLVELLINKMPKITSSRLTVLMDLLKILQNPTHNLEDDYGWIADIEEKNMGCSLTCSKTDALGTDFAATPCRELMDSGLKHGCMAVKISRSNEYKIKKGQSEGRSMCFLTVEDGSGSIDSVILFPDDYENFKGLLFKGNTVLLIGEIEKRKELSFIVKNVIQI